MWQLLNAIAAKHNSTPATARFGVGFIFVLYEPYSIGRKEPLMQVGDWQLAPGNPGLGAAEEELPQHSVMKEGSSLATPSPFICFRSPSSHCQLSHVANPAW